jgi:hypothetical protein
METRAEQRHEHLTEEEKNISAQKRSVAATLNEKVDLYKTRLGNPFGILRNSAINPIPDLLNSGIFVGILLFRS